MTLVELLHHRFLFGLRSLLVGLLLGVVLPDLPILDLRLLHSFLVLGLLGVIERIILLGPPFSDLHTDTCTGTRHLYSYTKRVLPVRDAEGGAAGAGGAAGGGRRGLARR